VNKKRIEEEIAKLQAKLALMLGDPPAVGSEAYMRVKVKGVDARDDTVLVEFPNYSGTVLDAYLYPGQLSAVPVGLAEGRKEYAAGDRVLVACVVTAFAPGDALPYRVRRVSAEADGPGIWVSPGDLAPPL
jgi:hypothetical protein